MEGPDEPIWTPPGPSIDHDGPSRPRGNEDHILPRAASFLIPDTDIEWIADPKTVRTRKLGEGTFAVAYAARLRRVTEVAVKVLKVKSSPDAKKRVSEALAKEVEVWQTLNDNHVLRFHGYWISPPALISDLADGGDLRGLLKEAQRRSNELGGPPYMPRELGLRYFKDIARGMRYLHSQGILHCDLKPENILIDGGVAKVADFGLADVRNAAGSPTRGTPGYIPPEAFEEKRDEAGDVYAFGVIAFEVLVGRSPYAMLSGGHFDARALAQMEFAKPHDFDDVDVWNLIDGSTARRKIERPTFIALVRIMSSWNVRSDQRSSLSTPEAAPPFSGSLSDLPQSSSVHQSPAEIASEPAPPDLPIGDSNPQNPTNSIKLWWSSLRNNTSENLPPPKMPLSDSSRTVVASDTIGSQALGSDGEILFELDKSVVDRLVSSTKEMLGAGVDALSSFLKKKSAISAAKTITPVSPTNEAAALSALENSVKFWTKKLQNPTSRRKEANNKGKVAFSAYLSQQSVAGLSQALLANSATDTLELAGSGFDADKIAIFAEALKTDKNIKRLRIDNSSKIGAAGAASIAEMLKENSTICSLDMSSCGLGPEGTAVVAASLEQNNSVTRLVLSTNDILVLGTEAIGSLLRTNKVIKVLDLSKNGLGDEGARRLGLSLKSNTSLQRLTMKANNIGTHGLNRLNVALSGNETLVELDLCDNPIGEAGARTLEQMLSKPRCRMRDLKLDNCSLGRAGIELLANGIRKSSSLRRLDLRSNDFGDVGAKLLMEAIQSNSLEELTISDNEIGPIGAKAAAEILRVNGSLKTLNMSANDVGDAGVIAVAKALAENPSTKLSKLFLNSNRVGDVGAVALGDMLKNNQMLVELHIASNEIKMQGFEAIARGLEGNKKLTELKHDKGWAADSDEGAEIIEKLKQHLVDNGSASKGALFKAPDVPKDSSVSLSID